MIHPEQAVLANGARDMTIQLNSHQLNQFTRYEKLLQRWNQKFNLTAIVESDGIQTRHFLDSLSCTMVTGDLTEQRLIDVGAGAGFPGLPLKILFPGLSLTLVESNTKKCRFLDAVISDLEIGDVTILNQRAEQIGQQQNHRERYDWAVARAVSSMSVLAEYLLPLVQIGGHILAQKGAKNEGEAASLEKVSLELGGGQPRLVPITIPGIESARHLIVVEKVTHTPALYPRRVGVPTKKPLN